MNKLILSIVLAFLGCNFAAAFDSIPSAFSRPLEWRIGAEISPAWVPGTNKFLEGNNQNGQIIKSNLGGDLRADFRFNHATRDGMLFQGLYQGIGLGVNTYFANNLLGTPVSAYVYQGAPIFHLGSRVWLGYEWQFGAAFGWKHFNTETADNNSAVSTSVTAHMGLGFKLHYSISDRVQMSVGIVGNHYSNGNTSWPNAGINTIGASIGLAYILNPLPQDKGTANNNIYIEADKDRWMYDIMIYGAFRKRVVSVGYPSEPQLCPGKFGIIGAQLSPMRSFNRYFAAGPSLDLQWDEGAGLAPYWLEGTSGEMIKFRRPAFGKQISVGFSAHAELTMPIFTVNAGIGYDVVNPKGERAFYQSLTLKTFISRNVYINTGYRLGAFKDPQNLMLGIGLRL